MGKCPAWCEGEQGLFSFSHDRCYATKEMEVCDCLGNEAFCNFYPEKRKAATNPKFGQWISVKDRLPTDPRFVLVYVRHPAVSSFSAWSCIMTDMWLGDKWLENTDEEVHEVTHWMPLPEPPKEDD